MRKWPALLAAVVLAAVVRAPAQQSLPEPRKDFGSSVTGAFEGWFDDTDGGRGFLVGYYNRNAQQELDIPVGPNNRIEPGGPDMGQPTHFLPGRRIGVFAVPTPKNFRPEDRLTWTLVANGQTTSIPLRLHPDYVLNPFTEVAVQNTPPIVRLEENGRTFQGPTATMDTALHLTARVSAPLPLAAWVADDLKYTSGTNAPPSKETPPLVVRWVKYRGEGKVTFDHATPEIKKLDQPRAPSAAFSGTAMTNITFSEPGDYVLHLTANDYSGDGGTNTNAVGCCWTTAFVKVTVTR